MPLIVHPQLQADCHALGTIDNCVVLLNRNASLPWFILVPDTQMQDLLDLPATELQRVTAVCQAVSRFIKTSLGYGKVNFAGLGNVVPQMHLHVIGRSEDDACWPAPVWGKLESQQDYARETLEDWVEILRRDYALCVTG
jgi:diadenosine tetraphosphate (Ap4A) HIT family hydrolase